MGAGSTEIFAQLLLEKRPLEQTCGFRSHLRPVQLEKMTASDAVHMDLISSRHTATKLTSRMRTQKQQKRGRPHSGTPCRGCFHVPDLASYQDINRVNTRLSMKPSSGGSLRSSMSCARHAAFKFASYGNCPKSGTTRGASSWRL